MLERELAELRVEWPATPDVSAAVVERITAAAAPRRAPRRRFARPFARPAIALAAFLALAAGATAAIPPLRDAVRDLLGLERAEIRRGPVTAPSPSPGRLGSRLDLGRPISLAAARQVAAVGPPAALATPDASYLAEDGPTPRVSYVFAPQRGIGTARETGVAVLMTVFSADFRPAVEKTLGQGSDFERLRVDGDPALFIFGDSHGFAYSSAGGFGFEPQRLAGNTLLVQRGTLLIRIEADVSKQRAIALARSIPR